MQKLNRRVVIAALGAFALLGAAQFSPVSAQINPGPSVKGKWKGTYTSTEGNGKAALSFKVTKDKDQGGGRQIKGNGKFGQSGKRKMVGVSSSGQWLVSLQPKGRNSEGFQMTGQVNGEATSISGTYQIQKLQGVGQPPTVTDEGTFSVTKQ